MADKKGRVNFPYIWRWRQSAMRSIDRKGQRCRVLVRGKMNSALVEFEDGFKVVASRNALRKAVPAMRRVAPFIVVFLLCVLAGAATGYLTQAAIRGTTDPKGYMRWR